MMLWRWWTVVGVLMSIHCVAWIKHIVNSVLGLRVMCAGRPLKTTPMQHTNPDASRIFSHWRTWQCGEVIAVVVRLGPLLGLLSTSAKESEGSTLTTKQKLCSAGGQVLHCKSHNMSISSIVSATPPQTQVARQNLM